MSLPQKLLEYRRAEKLSQEDLAAQLGVSRQSVSKWEQGLSFPETEKLIELSNRMGISIDCLLKGGTEEQNPPAEEPERPPKQPERKSPLTLILAVLLAVTSLALAFTLWRQKHPNPGQVYETSPQTSESTVESTLPTDTAEPEQTEPVAEPEAQGLENLDLLELRDWFYRFGREYRLDYMPRFSEEEGAPTDSGEYLYWASAIMMNYCDEDKGKMSRAYVETTVELHFGVTPVDHRSHHKQWTYDGQTEIYTTWPEGMRGQPYYLLNSIEVDGDRFTVHATCYSPMIYVDSEEVDALIYDALMEGSTEDLVRVSEVTITFQLNTLSFSAGEAEPGTPVFVAHTVTEYE